MEEDSHDENSEAIKDFSEKSKKRKLKTPSQLIALEKFYNEHKYPTEEMKSNLADHLGLTEKQISGWFCHRRLKDKKLKDSESYANTNLRQDRSSGVIQDKGSGGQDSCGSTKHGDYWHIDPREVDSRKPYGHDSTNEFLVSEQSNRIRENITGMDDTSSESSSSLQDRILSQSENAFDIENSRHLMHLTHGGVSLHTNPKFPNMRGYKPSGYLKVKGDIENAAITSVKRQLGMQYRENGPLLGVEFQPLPPGAFDSPRDDPVCEPSYVRNTIRLHSPCSSAGKMQRSLGSGHELNIQKLISHGSYTKDFAPTIHSQDKKSHNRLKRKSTKFNCTNPFPGPNSSSGEEMPFHNSIRNHKMSSNGHVEMIRSDSIPNLQSYYVGKTSTEETKYLLHDPSNIVCKQPNVIQNHRKGLDSEERGLSMRMKKEEDSDREENAIKEYHGEVRLKTNPDETTVAKQARVDFPQRDFVTRASFSEITKHTSHIQRFTTVIPLSLSEDEMVGTSSCSD